MKVSYQKECDPAAIASVNCTNEDQRCHCLRQEGILSNITACAEQSCDDPDHDIDGMWYIVSSIVHTLTPMLYLRNCSTTSVRSSTSLSQPRRRMGLPMLPM